MIGMKLGWLAFELILLGFFLYFGSSLALVFAGLLLLVPVLSLIINLVIRKSIKVSLSAAVNLRKGENGICKVRLENPTIFPVLKVRCKVSAENQLNREMQKKNIMTWLPPKKMQEESVSTGCDYCGRIRVSVERVILYDCFGLIGIPCTCNGIAHVTVQPDTFEMNVTLLPVSQGADDSDLYSQNKAGQDLSETFQIREYVPGDSPRQVHWKLSNKFDKLIVRDPGLPITRNVLIYWERTGETGDFERIDAQAEAIVSLCQSLLDQSIGFTIGWNDTDRNICILHEIRDMDELVGVIPRLLRATGKKDGVSGAGILTQTRPEALCAHMVYIAEEPQSEVMEMKRFGHVSVLLCGSTAIDGAVLFDSEHYIEQLAQIEM